jgi:23S rRNA (guanosine2251-2'-O)-methyltransferase
MSETRLIHGFHAVTAKLRHAADDVKEITVAEGRQDGRMRDLLKLAETHGVRVILSDAKRLDGLAGGSQHQGVVAKVAAQAKHVSLDDVLDNLAEPAAAAGARRRHRSAQPRRLPARRRRGRRARRGGAQGQGLWPQRHGDQGRQRRRRHVPYIVVTNLARSLREMQERGIWVIGAAGEADKELYAIDQKGPCAWVLGAEGDGMRRLTRETCDELARIPMHGSVESLNVSVSAGICLFEARRQRGK